MKALYNLFFILFSLLYLPYFLLKGKYHRDMKQRFGVFDKGTFTDISGSRPVWVHAVSVGEMKTAQSLISKIRQTAPSKRFVISNVTQTGHRIALSVAGPKDKVIYFPLDLSFIVRGLVGRLKPSLFVSIETEIWPNLITELADKRVPIAVVNGRISPASYRNYSIIRPVMRSILDKVTLFCMRTEQDAARIKALGASSENVHVTGNMKFDGVFSKDDGRQQEWRPVRDKDIWLKRPAELFIAGSTHRGEDGRILRSYKELKRSHPNLTLLIAPRHIERIGEIEGLTRRMGLNAVRMSEVEKKDRGGDGRDGGADTVFLLDSVGHLSLLYDLATVVFMGGSLVPHGGQNFIEPAARSKPVITGPYVHNFRYACDLFIRKDAIRIVRSYGELLDSLQTLLDDEKMRKSMGERAEKVVKDNVGSAEKTVRLMQRYL